MSGLGNVYSDEVLFHSNLHPASRAEKLEQNDFVKIYRMVHRVLDKSIQCQADPGRFPRSYLTPRREEGRACPKCSGKIRKATVSGRASFFCDKHQRKV
jgi:formamidopyrimidine-DNA glycosylase